MPGAAPTQRGTVGGIRWRECAAVLRSATLMSLSPCFLPARLVCFGLLLALLPLAGLRAQPLTLRVHHLGPDDGLAQGTVYAVLQDRLGFLWIGTQYGLHRWDGAEFTRHEHVARQPLSLSHNHVRALAEDAAGRLWVGTEGGLDRYEPSSASFVAVGGELAGLPVRALETTSAGDLWVGTTGGAFRIGAQPSARQRLPLPALADGSPQLSAMGGMGAGISIR